MTLTVVETLRGGKVIAVAASTKKKKKTVVVGSRSATVAAGATKTLKLALNATGKRLLAAYNPLKARLVIAQAGKTVARSTVTFRQAKKKKKK